MTTCLQIEVCIQHPTDAILAQQAGAARIEINSALRLDGLTPTPSVCRWLKNNCSLPIIAMVRPHDDGFVLSALDQQLALADCELLLDCGVDGIAYGALDGDGELNLDYFRQVAQLCGDRQLVCHRAFDRIPDQPRGLEQLIDCGVCRVLTSGGQPKAIQGTDRLKELMEMSRGRIEILPGGGIDSKNFWQIAAGTGCRQLHGTFRKRGVLNEIESVHLDPDELQKVCSSLTKS